MRWPVAIRQGGVLLCTMVAIQVHAESRIPWGAWDLDANELERWVRHVQPWAPETIRHLLDEFDPQLAVEWLRELQASLRDAELDPMALWQPYLRPALAELRQFPALRPYVAWLEARLDYFDEARRVRPRPVARARVPSRRPVARRPPPESDREVWRRRVAHAAPPRAAQMVPVLKHAFRRHGVPEALVWLAEVESSFNPAARSPAGAVGLYQLMPRTAAAMGLRVDADLDERLDPLKNADAAARYLAHLYRRFGAWPPALAAYNAGEMRVARVLQANGQDFDAALWQLPAETRMYVPRVLELVRLREGVDLAATTAAR